MRSYKPVMILFLVITALVAFAGGACLIFDPAGGTLGMDTGLLEHSPFDDFFIPGLVLFFALGGLSTAVLIAMLLKADNAYYYVSGQGMIILGWLAVQMMMLREVNLLQVMFAVIGVALAFMGARWKEFQENDSI